MNYDTEFLEIMRSKINANSVPAFESECIEYSKTGRGGYGRMVIGSKVVAAHRASWILNFGPIMHPALCVCHTCDNRACVNPNHLFLANRKVNNRDAIAKGRFITIPRQLQCKRGHPLVGDNVYESIGGSHIHRTCRICKKMKDLRYREERAKAKQSA